MASYSARPEPMLARSGRLPTSGDFAYEVKWDGFRAIVSTEGPLRVRSRCTLRVVDVRKGSVERRTVLIVEDMAAAV